MMLCLNLIGTGPGPLLAGVLSDLLTPQHGEEAKPGWLTSMDLGLVDAGIGFRTLQCGDR